MVTTTNPAALYELAENILECAAEGLASIGIGPGTGLEDPIGEPIRQCIVTGEYAWDDCECGQLLVQLVRSFPSDMPPLEGIADGRTGQKKCASGAYMGVDLVVSILRCSPETDNEHPPPCEALSAAARISVLDADAIRKALFCCLKSWSRTRDAQNFHEIFDFTVGPTVFVGARGICQGSETSLTVWLMNPCVDCEGS